MKPKSHVLTSHSAAGGGGRVLCKQAAFLEPKRRVYDRAGLGVGHTWGEERSSFGAHCYPSQRPVPHLHKSKPESQCLPYTRNSGYHSYYILIPALLSTDFQRSKVGSIPPPESCKIGEKHCSKPKLVSPSWPSASNHHNFILTSVEFLITGTPM